jgi:hypothetical protein
MRTTTSSIRALLQGGESVLDDGLPGDPDELLRCRQADAGTRTACQDDSDRTQRRHDRRLDGMSTQG